MKFIDFDIYCYEILCSLVLLLSKEGRKKLNYIKKNLWLFLLKFLFNYKVIYLFVFILSMFLFIGKNIE